MDTAEDLRELVFIRDLQIRVQSKKAMHEYIKGLMRAERVQRSRILNGLQSTSTQGAMATPFEQPSQ